MGNDISSVVTYGHENFTSQMMAKSKMKTARHKIKTTKRAAPERPVVPGGDPEHASKRITLEHTFPLPRKTRRGPRATKSTREKPRKSKPKPTPEKPLTPRPQRPKPPKKDRQEYDKTRSQTPERRAYRRRYAQQKRERQKYLGLCRDCSNPAIPGQVRCPTCSEKHRQAHRRNDAKLKVSPGQQVMPVQP